MVARIRPLIPPRWRAGVPTATLAGACPGTPAHPRGSRVRRDVLGEDLDGDRAVEAGVAGFVHLAHAPGPEGGDDLIRAEAGAASQRHRSCADFIEAVSSPRRGWPRTGPPRSRRRRYPRDKWFGRRARMGLSAVRTRLEVRKPRPRTTGRYLLRRRGSGGESQMHSTASATPLPPPRQRVATPRFSFRAFSAYSSVVRMRAPLAPMGCPSATAPPLTLTF